MAFSKIFGLVQKSGSPKNPTQQEGERGDNIKWDEGHTSE